MPSTPVLLYSLLKPDQAVSLNTSSINPSMLQPDVNSVQAHCSNALAGLTVAQ